VSSGNGKDPTAEPAPESVEPAAADAEATGLAPVGESGAGGELDALRRERDELRETLLRRRADFENLKKRGERDRQLAATEAVASILRRLVEPLDNLERALAAPGGETSLREGVELTLRAFRTALEAHGVVALDPLGEAFDPERHQALLEEAVPGYRPGTVAEVLRKGYLYKDRLLRPALVKVAGAEGGRGDAGVDEGGDGEVQ
jgi:molecular chaperone GrpE